jgi:hypothetical protein
MRQKIRADFTKPNPSYNIIFKKNFRRMYQITVTCKYCYFSIYMILVIILVYTAVLTIHEDPATATHRLQTNLNKIQLWWKKWRMKVNETKSVQVTFTLKKEHVSLCPTK